MENKITFTKTQSTTYKLQINNGTHLWANFTLDETGPSSGALMIRSDYGDYSYSWGSCGCSFKEFLTKLNEGYLLDKLGRRDQFDLQTTVSEVKRHIEEYFSNYKVHYSDVLSDEEIDSYPSSSPEYFLHGEHKEEYDYMMSSFEDYNRFSYLNSATSFVHNLPNVVLETIFDNDYSCIPIYHDYPPQLKLFVKDIWPEFVNILKEELKNKD